jgi:hypothetical protein
MIPPFVWHEVDTLSCTAADAGTDAADIGTGDECLLNLSFSLFFEAKPVETKPTCEGLSVGKRGNGKGGDSVCDEHEHGHEHDSLRCIRPSSRWVGLQRNVQLMVQERLQEALLATHRSFVAHAQQQRQQSMTTATTVAIANDTKPASAPVSPTHLCPRLLSACCGCLVALCDAMTLDRTHMHVACALHEHSSLPVARQVAVQLASALFPALLRTLGGQGPLLKFLKELPSLYAVSLP